MATWTAVAREPEKHNDADFPDSIRSQYYEDEVTWSIEASGARLANCWPARRRCALTQRRDIMI